MWVHKDNVGMHGASLAPFVIIRFTYTSLGIGTGALAIEFLHPVDGAYQSATCSGSMILCMTWFRLSHTLAII